MDVELFEFISNLIVLAVSSYFAILSISLLTYMRTEFNLNKPYIGCFLRWFLISLPLVSLNLIWSLMSILIFDYSINIHGLEYEAWAEAATYFQGFITPFIVAAVIVVVVLGIAEVYSIYMSDVSPAQKALYTSVFSAGLFAMYVFPWAVYGLLHGHIILAQDWPQFARTIVDGTFIWLIASFIIWHIPIFIKLLKPR